MLLDRVSNPGPLTYESGALPVALRGPASTSSLLLERIRRNQRYHKQDKKTNNPHLKVKVKVSHSLIAVGAMGLESHCIMGIAKAGGAHPAPFAA